MDDIRGLAIGPSFVVAEAGFALAFRREVAAQIEESFTKPAAGRPQDTVQSAQSAQPQTSRWSCPLDPPPRLAASTDRPSPCEEVIYDTPLLDLHRDRRTVSRHTL
jgi:hypothetical protein